MKYDIVIFREIDNFIENCNFTEDKERYLLLMCKEKSNVEITLEMTVSEAATEIYNVIDLEFPL